MKYFNSILFIFFTLSVSMISAATEKPLILEGGYKGVFSSGRIESNLYHQAYIKGGYQWDFFNTAVTGSRYFNYHISNKSGILKYVDVNRIKGEGEVKFNDSISLSMEVSGWFGQNNYSRIEGLAGLSVEKWKWSFTGEAAGGRATYDFNIIQEMTFYGDFYFEATRYIFDNFSIDGSYSFTYAGMNGVEGIHKHLIRGGTGYMRGKDMFLFGGATFGIDSNTYTNVAFDFGGMFFIFKYIKLSASYKVSYGNSFEDTGDTMMPLPGGGAAKERRLSHRLLFGIALKYR